MCHSALYHTYSYLTKICIVFGLNKTFDPFTENHKPRRAKKRRM